MNNGIGCVWEILGVCLFLDVCTKKKFERSSFDVLSADYWHTITDPVSIIIILWKIVGFNNDF